MKRKYYVFDLDGTLVDSMPYWSKAMLSVLDQAKITYPNDILDIICPLGYAGTARYFIENLGVKGDIEQLAMDMQNSTLVYYQNSIPLKEGVEKYLREMKSLGHSLNVLTASRHSALDSALKRLGVFDLFDNVWSCDDFSTTKSDPKIHLMACERLGTIPNDVAFFDDNINSIETAKKAGIFTVGVYDVSGKNFNEQLKQTADIYISSFSVAEEY